VPLSTIATIQEVTGPQTVNRVNGDRDATITGTITANDTCRQGVAAWMRLTVGMGSLQ
jgi:multidrug efflux pump subunit AcrB